MESSPDQQDDKTDAIRSDRGGNEGYLLLVEFGHKHLDFLLPELLSMLEMNGIAVRNNGDEKETSTTCSLLPLPNEDRCPPETDGTPRRAFALLQFSSHMVSPDIISTLFSRCVLVKRAIELWGRPGTTLDDAVRNTRHWMRHSDIYRATRGSGSWKISIHTLGTKYTRREQDDMRLQYAFLDLPGKVQMKDPTHEYILIREIELDGKGSPVHPRHGHDGKLIVENDRRPALGYYFGRILWTRENYERFELKRRSYLGPTSMDAELSFVMANLGQVRGGSVVLDPFVGTGSILVACALRGAYCVGTDIDIRVLRGRGTDQNIFTNFSQFQLPRPELIRSDNAIYHRHFRTPHARPWVDTIVTDPPYGIRAGARKSGSRLDHPRPVLEENRHDHIAQTRPYSVSDVMADLLDVAARVLVMGGRLVYVIPSFATDFDPNVDLPQHECLELVYLSFQPFTVELGRRMVTMKKIQEYDPALRENYLAKTWKNGAASAEKCANIRDKILESAKLKPGYEEKARIRKQKRKEHKETKKRTKLQRQS